jgi:hypothetical protein
MSFRHLLRIDWDLIAGIIAALVAMLLSFMGLVSATVGLGIILLLCSLLLTRDLCGEYREKPIFDKFDLIKRHISSLTTAKQAGVDYLEAQREGLRIRLSGDVRRVIDRISTLCRLRRFG